MKYSNLLRILTLSLFIIASSFAFSQTRKGEVTNVSGDIVTINLGQADEVKEGMEGKIYFVVKVGEEDRFIYVAEFNIESISKNTSTAKITSSTGQVRVGYKVEWAEELVPQVGPYYGSLSLSGVPSDAAAYIDGKLIQRGNYSNIRVEEGSHILKISGSKYEDWAKDFNIVKDKKLAINVPRLTVKTGSLYLETIPSKAEILIGRRSYGTTPKQIDNLPIGSYTVTYRLQGYQEKTRSYSVRHNQTSRHQEPLTTLFGKLEITASIEAQVFLDGEEKGKTPITLEEISSGTHKLKLVVDYDTWEKEVIVEPNKTTTIHHPFPLTGSLSINSIPSGLVLIDGKEYGTTPLFIEKLKEGIYTLEIKRENYETLSESIKIEAYKTTVVVRELKEGY